MIGHISHKCNTPFLRYISMVRTSIPNADTFLFNHMDDDYIRCNASVYLHQRSSYSVAVIGYVGMHYIQAAKCQRLMIFAFDCVEPYLYFLSYRIMLCYLNPDGTFMGQHGAPPGPVGPRWAPRWPHVPWYQGIFRVAVYICIEAMASMTPYCVCRTGNLIVCLAWCFYSYGL